MFFQIALQCDCIIVDSIVRAEDQRDATLSRCCKNRFQSFRTFIQFGEVFSLELFPLCRIVAEPFTQFRAGRNVFQPAIQTQSFFLYAARPEPLYQESSAIIRTHRIVGPFH